MNRFRDRKSGYRVNDDDDAESIDNNDEKLTISVLGALSVMRERPTLSNVLSQD